MDNEFYTQNGYKGENYDSNLSVKEIAARIREYVKKEFPDCKFSVRKDVYSGGASIYIVLFESSEDVLNRSVADKDNYQLNHFNFEDSEFLSEYGKKLFSSVGGFVSSFRRSDCDGMIDYFDTNFYQHFEVGKWDMPYKVVFKEKKIKESTASICDIKIIEYSPKSFAVIGETKPLKDTLKELGGSFNFRLTCGAGWIFPNTKKEAVISALSL